MEAKGVGSAFKVGRGTSERFRAAATAFGGSERGACRACKSRHAPAAAPLSMCPAWWTWGVGSRTRRGRWTQSGARVARGDCGAAAAPAGAGGSRRISTAGWRASSAPAHRTNDTCTPRLRWMPAQARQMYTPYGTEAQVGFFAGQSKQTCEGRGGGGGQPTGGRRRACGSSSGACRRRPRPLSRPAQIGILALETNGRPPERRVASESGARYSRRPAGFHAAPGRDVGAEAGLPQPVRPLARAPGPHLVLGLPPELPEQRVAIQGALHDLMYYVAPTRPARGGGTGGAILQQQAPSAAPACSVRLPFGKREILLLKGRQRGPSPVGSLTQVSVLSWPVFRRGHGRFVRRIALHPADDDR